MEIADRFARYTERLSTLNRIAARLGAFSVLHSMYEIELGNPLLGAIQAVAGMTTLVASTNELHVSDNQRDAG